MLCQYICICMSSGILITVMALASTVQVRTYQKWGLYGVAEQKGDWRTVLYNGFRFVFNGIIVTGLP